MGQIYVAVCGASRATPDEETSAEEIGRRLAEAGAIVVTGGLGGVMAAAAKGAREAGGITLGLLPGTDRDHADPHNTVTVPTGMGEGRNMLVVRSADALIAIGGEFGTLSEIGFALRIGVPVVGLQTWELARTGLDIPIQVATSSQQAVELALAAVAR